MNDQLYVSYVNALKDCPAPALFLDLDAFYKNIQWVKQNAGEKKIRLATKSLRSKEILRRILEADSIFQGLMTYDLREALWLREEGFDDILMGYPTMDRMALEILAKKPHGITLMVDLPEHLVYLNEIAQSVQGKFNICLDIDLSMDLPGVRFGVYRSSVNSELSLREFLQTLKKCHHLSLTGLMGYEAQIAGVMDKESWLMRFLKKLSVKQLQKRRKLLFDIIEQEGHKLQFVNGGGTGSLFLTNQESCVTEITVGSGFYAPVLFDHYERFTLSPALCFTLPIVRNPAPGIFTALGGGYIASGEIGVIKQPTPYLPKGLSLLKHEGAGEVQTPMKYSGNQKLKVGDLAIMRHAKAGEVCERFSYIHLIKNGEYQGKLSTYRGEGQTFI